MLILHDYRTGNRIGITPGDIRPPIEDRGAFCIVPYTTPVLIPERQIATPQGLVVAPSQVQKTLVYAEVIESLEEIQFAISSLAARAQGHFIGSHYPPIVAGRAATIAEGLRKHGFDSFGAGPREEVIVVEKA